MNCCISWCQSKLDNKLKLWVVETSQDTLPLRRIVGSLKNIELFQAYSDDLFSAQEVQFQPYLELRLVLYSNYSVEKNCVVRSWRFIMPLALNLLTSIADEYILGTSFMRIATPFQISIFLKIKLQHLELKHRGSSNTLLQLKVPGLNMTSEGNGSTTTPQKLICQSLLNQLKFSLWRHHVPVHEPHLFYERILFWALGVDCWAGCSVSSVSSCQPSLVKNEDYRIVQGKGNGCVDSRDPEAPKDRKGKRRCTFLWSVIASAGEATTWGIARKMGILAVVVVVDDLLGLFSCLLNLVTVLLPGLFSPLLCLSVHVCHSLHQLLF